MSTVVEMTSELNVLCTVIYNVNGVVSGEIYTAGKKITLLPAVTALTNITSEFTYKLRTDLEFQFYNVFKSLPVCPCVYACVHVCLHCIEHRI